MKLHFHPVIPLLEIYPKEPKALIQKNISSPMFIVALFTTSRIWKQPKCPSVNEWIKQLWDIYTMEYYSAVKKEENFTLCDRVWTENIMLSEISQPEKNKYHMISCTCGISQPELTSKTQADP